jgi:hypothetical protein
MTDQDKRDTGGLVRAARSDVAPVATQNPLISRGLADLAVMENFPPAPNPVTQPRAYALYQQLKQLHTRAGLHLARLRAASRHPFDLPPAPPFNQQAQALEGHLPLKEEPIPPAAGPTARLPEPGLKPQEDDKQPHAGRNLEGVP